MASAPLNSYYILKYEKYQKYIEELKKHRYNKPLHLHSFYVYLAYTNAWKLIHRDKISPEQIDIMNKLNCYKPTRSELGIKRCRPI